MSLPEGDNAIVCRDVCKTFGSNKSAYQVLQNVNITVPKGTIYALLGPSGCGKTTLLRCILSRLNINEGTILVYDEPPQNNYDPSRPKIGYMPQDIALTEELTGDETLQLFGNIAKMSRKEINEQSKFLNKFLEMPFHKREIRRLSGGQKRKISFAVALIHEPAILILDEPTVGVDPPLRKSIWEYLYKIAETKNVTIVVTTHYIEEAHMAHNVGLMLNGSMVAEGKPDLLIEQYGCQNLEKVFLKLCLQCETEEGQNTKIDDSICERIEVVDAKKDEEDVKSTQKSVDNKKSLSNKLFTCQQWPSAQRIWALFMKDLWLITRQPAFMLGIFGLPVVVMGLFPLCIGNALKGLPLGIVNHDLMNYSQLYLQSIDSSLIKQVHYNDYNVAFKDAKDGKLWGIIHLNANFSNAIQERYSKILLVDDLSVNDSLIGIAMDLSNKNVEVIINLELLKSYRRFLQAVFHQMGSNTMLADLPLKYAPQQVYGSIDSNFGDYLYPSFMMGATYYVMMASSAMTLIVAKESGNLDRLYISGVDFLEVAFGQLITQIFIMVAQTILSFITVFGILKFACAGSHVLAFMLNIVQGFCGISFGILISSCCDSQTMTIIVNISVFLLCSVTNTFIFPLEGASYIVRTITWMSPQNYAFEAFRSILIRGWDLRFRTVQAGFSLSFLWSAIFIAVSVIVFRLKR